MTFTPIPLPSHLSAPTLIGDEISLTGKWTPKTSSRFFGRSNDSEGMHSALTSLLAIAESDPRVLTFELNDTIGGDSLVVHTVFANQKGLIDFYGDKGSEHFESLLSHANADLHLLRGVSLTSETIKTLAEKSVPVAAGEHVFGYVKNDSTQPNLRAAIDVTAKWTCIPGAGSQLGELKHWWQMVGTDAFDMEKGLIRFEVYQVVGEDALLIHEVFEDTAELKFHLTKGTAHKYKKSIDQVAAPERYVFRGNVSWLIRTYSKFMRLPATYSTRKSRVTKPGGSMSDGTR
ncbi:hypothetical protein [Candidatus Lucifugimonas marina]|uniref:ABM domain-containing protein n=1 Tax=Candidatus Lucifugimonas marina TaxID=3038979 RepID=A0AAJ5ZI30_9CHLR|nr:hypothetical protein [SAR202 cluster bacterium JH702]MDG0870916.1 hypothetical protein [SAR202 cluster bacterium JH639]WFG35850.1 hypothetical protein GKN94_09130 [SAR202 cluster bacterium JH545]WFG39795.1 hypothetical protein GKO48_09240 [SAR202 cluster bacterium JH1073]